MLTVSGSDALTYLQGQISQDIQDLGDGESAYTFVLQPIGKVEALARVRRVSADEFVVDTDSGYGETLAARLNRFKIRVDVDISRRSQMMVAVRGSDIPIDDATPAWGRRDAFDLFDRDAPAGVRHGTADELDAARIEAGWPAMGSEITDATIPAETGVVSLAVNFTKGCYPGQELVERMDSRGSSAPRFVRRLRGEGSAAVGDTVVHDGKEVGALTSVADSDEGWLALASISRSVHVSDSVTVRTEAGTVEAAVEETLF